MHFNKARQLHLTYGMSLDGECPLKLDEDDYVLSISRILLFLMPGVLRCFGGNWLWFILPMFVAKIRYPGYNLFRSSIAVFVFSRDDKNDGAGFSEFGG
jgi:hypothetical protein